MVSLDSVTVHFQARRLHAAAWQGASSPSPDAEAWTTLAEAFTDDDSAGAEGTDGLLSVHFSFAPVSSIYWRLLVLESFHGRYISVSEIVATLSGEAASGVGLCDDATVDAAATSAVVGADAWAMSPVVRSWSSGSTEKFRAPSHAIDGSFLTGWHALSARDQWLIVDMLGVVVVESVHVAFPPGAAQTLAIRLPESGEGEDVWNAGFTAAVPARWRTVQRQSVPENVHGITFAALGSKGPGSGADQLTTRWVRLDVSDCHAGCDHIVVQEISITRHAP